MKRLAVFLASTALAGATIAQTPAPDLGPNPPKTVKVHAELKNGAKVEVRQPDIIDNKLCGWVFPAGAPADVMPKSECIPMADVASTRVEGARFAVGESVEGALCVVLMPLCLAKVQAVQDRIVRDKAEKAKAQ
jgi:hypothetical protein